jgi:hypothetical protein
MSHDSILVTNGLKAGIGQLVCYRNFKGKPARVLYRDFSIESLHVAD